MSAESNFATRQVVCAIAALTLLAGTPAPAAAPASEAPNAAASSQNTGADQARQQREREKRLGKLRRQYTKQLAKCQRGNQFSCRDARVTLGEIHELAPTVPPQPES